MMTRMETSGDGDASTRTSDDGATVGREAARSAVRPHELSWANGELLTQIVLRRVQRMPQAQELGGRGCSMIGGPGGA